MTFAFNGSPHRLITEQGTQFMCYDFSADTSEYETVFNDNGSAFVPLSQMIPYIQKKMWLYDNGIVQDQTEAEIQHGIVRR